ncbi:MAG: CehA/McbA family metallohydrolase [Elusimicrobiota bacterium]
MYDYSGAIHMHSNYSFDGNTSVESIIESAKRAGLDFIVITDHLRLDAKNAGYEGWHDGVLVLVGEEITPKYNHYVALGIDKPVIAWKEKSVPQEYIDKVAEQGGTGLIAHPDHTGAPKFGIKGYPWKDWSVKGYAGLGIWDLMTDWQEKLVSTGAAAFAYIFPDFVLSGPKKETLERWDALNACGRIAGYGEIDNHNSLKRYFGLNFRIFPFDFAFSTIRTHVLLNEQLNRDFRAAHKQIIDAIRNCRLYVAQEHGASAKGFMFRIYNSEETATTGMEFRLTDKPTMLETRLPLPGLIRVVRNGETIYEEYKKHANLEIDRLGVYRIEAFRKKMGFLKPWIFSNPIWVV